MATSIKDVKDLGAWMRETGVQSVTLSDGTKIEMGAPKREPSKPLSPAEIALAAREKHERTMFASTSMRPVRPKAAQ